MTPNQLASAVHVTLPWRGIFPFGVSTLGGNERAIVAGMYSARFSPAITSTTKLTLPVDCVLAGQQPQFRPGRAIGAVLRGIFRE